LSSSCPSGRSDREGAGARAYIVHALGSFLFLVNGDNCAAARAVNGAFAAGVMPVAMAYVGESSTAETRRRQIGKMMGMMFPGGALATLIGGTLSQFGSWRLVYFLYGAAKLILLAPLFRSLRGKPRSPSPPGGFLAPHKEVLGPRDSSLRRASSSSSASPPWGPSPPSADSSRTGPASDCSS
jgi:MFS family permease